jgi:hypothetical protein
VRPFNRRASNSFDSLRGGLTKGKVLRASLIAGGLAVLTAGSAGISSLRRREKGTRDDS